MNTYTYLGNTAQSLAFRATNNVTGDVMDFGVFDFPAVFETDENGELTDVELQPARPYFTTFFGLFVNENGTFLPEVQGFDLACESYINILGWQWPQSETEPTE